MSPCGSKYGRTTLYSKVVKHKMCHGCGSVNNRGDVRRFRLCDEVVRPRSWTSNVSPLQEKFVLHIVSQRCCGCLDIIWTHFLYISLDMGGLLCFFLWNSFMLGYTVHFAFNRSSFCCLPVHLPLNNYEWYRRFCNKDRAVVGWTSNQAHLVAQRSSFWHDAWMSIASISIWLNARLRRRLRIWEASIWRTIIKEKCCWKRCSFCEQMVLV